MADNDKGYLSGSDPVPPDLVTKVAPFVVASEPKRFALDQLHILTEAVPLVNVIGEGKMETVSNEWE